MLGSSFYFVEICFLFSIIMFCIFYFNKNVKYSLYHAYFASSWVAVSKQKVCCYWLNCPEMWECDKNLEILTQSTLINYFQCGKFSEFFELSKYGFLIILYWLSCLGRLLLCLHMFACLMFLFVDRSIKYAEAFSIQCLIIILVIFYSR